MQQRFVLRPHLEAVLGLDLSDPADAYWYARGTEQRHRLYH
jgi:hypothetical protein